MTNKSPYEQIEKLVEAGKFANQDSWHVVGMPWNNHNPYINTVSNDPHLGRAIIDVIEPDCIEGDNDEEITKKEIELEAEMNANMRFVAMAGNSRKAIQEMLAEHKRIEKIKSQVDVEALREALELYNKQPNTMVYQGTIGKAAQTLLTLLEGE